MLEADNASEQSCPWNGSVCWDHSAPWAEHCLPQEQVSDHSVLSEWNSAMMEAESFVSCSANQVVLSSLLMKMHYWDICSCWVSCPKYPVPTLRSYLSQSPYCGPDSLLSYPPGVSVLLAVSGLCSSLPRRGAYSRVAGLPCVSSFSERLQGLSLSLFWNVSPGRPGWKHPGHSRTPRSLSPAPFSRWSSPMWLHLGL